MEDLVDGGGSHGGSVRGQQGFPIQVDGQVGEHRAGVIDDGLVLGVQAVDQPAYESDLGEELGSREDVQVDGAALMPESTQYPGLGRPRARWSTRR